MIREFVSRSLVREEKDYVKSFSFSLNPDNNGGEDISIEIHQYDNGEKDPALHFYYRMEIKAECYGTHSTTLSMMIPDLSKLIDNLSDVQKKMA